VNGRHAGSTIAPLRHEGGQILPMTALMMVVLCGFAAMVVDIGRVWIAQRQLQNAVDATALAIAQNMPNNYAGWSQTPSYDGVAPSPNAVFGYGVTPNAPTVQFECTSEAAGYDSVTGTCPADTSPEDASKPCRPGTSLSPTPATSGCNAVIVKETAKVKTTFAAIPPFGFATFTVSATSVAAARGGQTKPLDVAVVVDSTASMNSACGDTVPGISGTADKIDCAKEGVRTLLNGLWPCDATYQSCAGQSPLDKASLLTFPGLKDAGAYTHDKTKPPVFTNDALEFGCPGNYSSAPSWYQGSNGGFPGWYIVSGDLTYSGSPDYVITPLSNDFKTSASSALNNSSHLVSAVNWNTCAGGKYPGNEYYGLNSPGGVSTYYAGAISAAQAELAADSARGAQPVIILLSDGDANTQSPQQCTRAVQAAQSAAAAGTWVYSVMYGQTSTSGGCSGDGTYTAYTAMKAIASDPSKFFCDPKPSGATCQSSATLNAIFEHIAEDVTNARLIG
jgi:Putative Flp pilus-assembly TadE/G-like